MSLHTMQRQQVNTLDYTIFSIVILLNITTAICHVRTALQNAYNTMQLHRESKKGVTLTMAKALSILDRFAKFFHCCKEH